MSIWKRCSSKDGHYYYKYGDGERPVVEKQITVPYRTGHGMAEKKFTAYYTQHGPVIRDQDGKWVTIRLMQEPVKALTQSYLRTKAKTYKDYLQTMELRGELVQQHHLCRCGWTHRLLSRQLHSPQRHEVRLHQAGGWKRSGNGVARAADRRGVAASAGSGERLRLQRE